MPGLRDSATNNGDPHSGGWKRLLRRGCVQLVDIIDRRRAEGVDLVGCPKMSREFFGKFAGQIDPIDAFEFRGKPELREGRHRLPPLVWRKRIEIGKLAV